MMEEKVVMVTGASSGIGRELCLYLAKSGRCRIVAAARRTDRLKSLCEEINDSKPDKVRAVAVELDVTAESSAIDASVNKAWEAFGKIDVLVNNAGVRGGVFSPLDWPEEEWENSLRTNLTGLWLVSKHACKRMRDAGLKGSVINISSLVGLNRIQQHGAIAYVASKTGVNAITKAMALELGEYNIRVNAIAPGVFKSEITEGLLRKPWLKNVEMKIVPLRTCGTSDPAITSLVSYLINDSLEYMTGNIFIVDAGASLPGVPIFSSL